MVKKQIKNGTIHRYLRVLGVGLDILKTRIDQDCHGHYPLSGEMAEWSKALVLGTSLNRRGFKSHSRQRFGKGLFRTEDYYINIELNVVCRSRLLN